MRKQFFNLPFAAGHDGARLRQGLWLKGKKTIPLTRNNLLEFQLMACDFWLERAKAKVVRLLEVIK